MRFGLQIKLTLSHLIVTLVSVFILMAIILAGYWIYLRTDAVASWAGDQAAVIADDIVWLLDDDPLTGQTAAEILYSLGFEPAPDTDDPELLVIFAPDGQVLASSNERRFRSGTRIDFSQLPGFDRTLAQMSHAEIEAQNLEDLVAYAAEGKDHIGQAAIIDLEGEQLGWVYYRSSSEVIVPFTSTEALAGLALILLGAALIATVVSGLVGGLLAYSFSRRLKRLSQVSAALATGDLGQRVPNSLRTDEIDQVGAQFNAMADQLTAQMHQLRQLAERNALLAEESRSLAKLEERNRLARELHDALKQQIFGLSLTAASIRQLWQKDAGLASERLVQLEQQARDVHQEMDGIIRQLRPAALEDRGLAPALGQLVANWQEQTGLPVSLTINGERALPLATEQTFYRIAQEALNNIARHAGAKQVEMWLKYRPEQVELGVADDGHGFDPTQPQPVQSLGLRGMQERIEELGGQFTLNSAPGRGTTIVASLQTSLPGAAYD